MLRELGTALHALQARHGAESRSREQAEREAQEQRNKARALTVQRRKLSADHQLMKQVF